MVIVAPVLTLSVLVIAFHRGRARSRQERVIDDQLRAASAALAALALEMRSGASRERALAAALECVDADELPWLAQLVAAPDTPPDAGAPVAIRGLSVALQLSRTTGASLAVLCDRLQAAVAAEESGRRELVEGLAGPRSTATLLCCLPVVGVVLSTVVGAHPLDFLLGSTRGSTCLVIGVALMVAGQAWTARLVRRAAREALG
jgi:tight adherence protein B